MGNNLTSAQSLAYQGTNAASPSNVTVHYNAPTANYYQGFQIGDFWVHRISPTSNNNELWVLMGVAGNVANWVLLSGGFGPLLTLTGNTGGAVSPLLGNINVVGDGTTISVAGNPGTHTLTISALGSGTVETLTGNSGGAVSPSAGNINVVGDGSTINIVGNPGTHTLTASAVGTGIVQSLTTDDTHVVTPTAGTIVLHGGNNITTSGTVGPNTATISVSGTTQYAVQVGNATASLTSLPLGTSGQVLTSNGAGSNPSWQASSGGTVTTLHTDDGHNVTATAGVINISTGYSSQNCGSTVEFTGTVGPNTVTLNVTDANSNTIIGKSSGNATLSGTDNAIIGASSGTGLTTGYQNVFVGYNNGNALTTEAGNVIIGQGNPGVVSSAYFVAISPAGTSGMGPASQGNYLHNYPGAGGGNVFMGIYSGQSASNVNNADNTAIGQASLSNLTTGTNNVALGYQAGFSLTTGSNNTLLGRDAGLTYTSNESNNIIIGLQGVVGESHVTKIGGIRGVTTTNNNAIAVLIDSAGQLGTTSSSIRYKENVKDMADDSSPLMKLRPVTFNYKKYGPQSKDYGLIAEEVAEVFPDLVINNDQGQPETVKYHIICSLLLNEVQKLEKRIKELESKQ